MEYCKNFNVEAGTMGIRSFGSGAESIEIDQCGGSPLQVSNTMEKDFGFIPPTNG